MLAMNLHKFLFEAAFFILVELATIKIVTSP